jgi:TRAP-type uncharacterized transport system substrate-binding protein
MTNRARVLLPAVVACAVAALAWWLSGLWSPLPPRSLTLATGPPGSASALLGQRYRDALARSRIDVRLRATAGAVESLALLREPASGVDAAFLQAGIPGAADAPGLVSLGTMYYEPLWLFRRGPGAPPAPADLLGKRLAVGLEGSGTRALTLRLLGLLGIDGRNTDLRPLGPLEAADALADGAIDFAAMVTAWESPVVQRLLATPGIELVSFPRADAHLARSPFLNKVVLPAGVADLARNIPPADVVLLAPKSSLVVRRDLHPSLLYLLLDAATGFHSRPGLFTGAGTFPAAEPIDVPLAEDAQQYYKRGRPFLQRYMPFWLASLVERLFLLVLPIVGVGIPLVRWLPSVYGWGMQRRIVRLYGDLKRVELAAEELPAAADAAGLLARLDELEARASHLRVLKSQLPTAYAFRRDVRLVRERLERKHAPRGEIGAAADGPRLSSPA